MRQYFLLLPLGAAAWLGWGDSASGQHNPQESRPPAVLPPGMTPAGSASENFSAPVNPFPLTPEAGPWLICAAHYVGRDGAELSRQVAVELREKHHLNAWIYNRGEEERRRQNEEWQRFRAQFPPDVPIHRRGVRIQDQYAVLVGGFPDQESASRFLPKIKGLELPKLTLEGEKIPYQTVTSVQVDPQTKKPVVVRAMVNPFHTAMVVRNPLTASAQPNRPKWDPAWKTLNANEEYSLLKNPRSWTLVVKEYSGGSQLVQAEPGKQPGLFDSLFGWNKKVDTLELAARQADELARFLSSPQLGFQAWVLHTRKSSVVTVGGFNGPDDPELERLRRQLAALKFSSNQAQGDPIGLLPNPIPIEVPRP
jgi:hypothetical protein